MDLVVDAMKRRLDLPGTVRTGPSRNDICGPVFEC
jgi:hypothetical protein